MGIGGARFSRSPSFQMDDITESFRECLVSDTYSVWLYKDESKLLTMGEQGSPVLPNLEMDDC